MTNTPTTNEEIRNEVRTIKRSDLLEVLDKHFAEGKINITVRRYNSIITDLGFSLETHHRPANPAGTEE